MSGGGRMEQGERSILLLLLVITLSISHTTAYNCERLDGLHGSCYVIVRKPMTWQDALFDCTNRKNGKLVSVESKQEMDGLQRALLKNHGLLVYYAGAITTNNHKSWFWYHTGTDLQSTAGFYIWEKGQPDNRGGRGENCAGLDFRPGHGGGLADFQCDERHAYICEVATPDYGDYYGLDLDERQINIPVG